MQGGILFRFVLILWVAQLCFVTFQASAEIVKRDPNLLLNQYYSLKLSHPKVAKETLEVLLKEYPNNVTALKETGYWYLTHKNLPSALSYFQRAYALDPHDYSLALQIGYLLDELQKKNEAKMYFRRAQQSPDLNINEKADIALEILAPSVQPHLLPESVTRPIFVSGFPKNKMDQYYGLKKVQPKAAENFLQKIIREDPKNSHALAEMAYLYLKKGQKQSAVEYFKKAYSINHDSVIAAEIGYLQDSLNNKQEALRYFMEAAKSSDLPLREKSLKAITIIRAQINEKNNPIKTKSTNKSGSAKKASNADILLNKYYLASKAKHVESENILYRAIMLEPDNVQALTEMGYLQLRKHNYEKAYCCFRQVFLITGDYKIAAQLGYICDAMGRKYESYQNFHYAADSSDSKLRYQSKLAMTNLAGWQTRLLRDPYFADIYVSPLYYSRFDLAVLPVNARVGIYADDKKQWEIYLGLRATKDDRSLVGVSPQIFEDNVAIFSVGTRYQPFLTTPLYFYGELGRAYDLMYRHRSRWRGDARGGAFYMNAWGARPTYVDKMHFPFKFVADAYGDASYYTRYDNNFIATARLRPGLRLFEFHNTYLNAYLNNQIIGDTNHEFFNNLFEWGPGIVLIPDDRFNLAIRFEVLRGYYFKVNSPDPNPYGSHYNNKVAMVEYYVRF